MQVLGGDEVGVLGWNSPHRVRADGAPLDDEAEWSMDPAGLLPYISDGTSIFRMARSRFGTPANG